MTKPAVLALLAVPLLTSGCAARVAALEARLSELEHAIYGPSPAEEAAAEDLFKRALATFDPADPLGVPSDLAKKLLEQVLTEYGQTAAAEHASWQLESWQVLGREIPGVAVDHWIQGEGALDGARVSLLAFWEVWCPHCQREMPNLNRWLETFPASDLQVLSFTRLTRGATEGQVVEFAAAHDLRFPIGVDTGTMSTLLGVNGVPAAAAVRDGVVIWRGHPAEIDAAMITGWTR